MDNHRTRQKDTQKSNRGDRMRYFNERELKAVRYLIDYYLGRIKDKDIPGEIEDIILKLDYLIDDYD